MGSGDPGPPAAESRPSVLSVCSSGFDRADRRHAESHATSLDGRSGRVTEPAFGVVREWHFDLRTRRPVTGEVEWMARNILCAR